MKENLTPAALTALGKGDVDNFLVAATPGGIERQEAEGQQQFVQNQTLPKQILYGTQAQLESMGIVFGEEVDDLFVRVQLPVGWKKQATDHAMWSELLDAQGRRRAVIFYKAAFYDRKAHIALTERYSIHRYEPCDVLGTVVPYDVMTHYLTVIKDGKEILRRIGVREKNHGIGGAHEKQAEAWLLDHYPDWRNPLAYWD